MNSSRILSGAWIIFCILSVAVVGLVLSAGKVTALPGTLLMVIVAMGLLLGTQWLNKVLPPADLADSARGADELSLKCRNCGYDLRASTERCPECGTPIPVPEIAPTPMVRRTLLKARKLAADAGVGYVGTEHLLLALFSEPEGVAFAVLDAWGLNEADVREEIGEVLAPPFAKLAPAEAKTSEQPA